MEPEVLTDVFTINLNQDQKVYRVVANGGVNFQKAMDAITTVSEISASHPEFKIIIDLETVNYHPSFEELMALKDKIMICKKSFTNKIALISVGKIKILADMICAFSITASIRMKSFSNEEEAMIWLNS